MAWLKYFFLSFFNDKYAEEAHKRSLLNSFLSLFLSLSIMCSMLFGGYCTSMDYHYEKDEDYRNKIYSILSANGQLNIENGKFSFVENQIPAVINEISNEMVVITDTRDINSAFIEFTVTYIAKNGATIPYENYLLLDENEKAQYTFSVEYTNKLIDFNSEKIAGYESYILSQSSEEIKNQLSQLQNNDRAYPTKLYELFVKSYYPNEVIALDIYSFAPTLRTYYDDIVSKTNTEFFILYEDLLYTKFQYDSISYIITGDPESMSDRAISSQHDIDDLIFDSFEQSKSYIIIEYIFNFIRLCPIIMMGCLVIAFVPWLFFKASKNSKMSAYLTSFKLINLYSLVASILSGIIGFILSWHFDRGQTYRIAILCFAVVITLRIVLYMVAQLIKLNKNE